MIRRIRRTLPWFGAVAALLLLALPVQADDIEPEPYVEEEVELEPEPEPAPEVEAEVEEEEEAATDVNRDVFNPLFDVIFIRPLYITRLVAGLPFFIAYPLTLGSGYSEDVVALLWTEPYEATFNRPLGEPADEY
jgi:hypothetical protein